MVICWYSYDMFLSEKGKQRQSLYIKRDIILIKTSNYQYFHNRSIKSEVQDEWFSIREMLYSFNLESRKCFQWIISSNNPAHGKKKGKT